MAGVHGGTGVSVADDAGEWKSDEADEADGMAGVHGGTGVSVTDVTGE